jgi:phosphoesterase RecJ-like protein
MQITPAIQELRKTLEGARSVLLTGPKDPDGDSIGACMALGRAVQALGSARVTIAGIANYRYDWMPGANAMVSDSDIRPEYDVVVVMDGDKTRLTPAVEAAFLAAEIRCLVDHHGSTDPSGYGICVLDPSSPSTCEMVYTMLADWGVPLDRDLATMLYTGIIFDTGGFRHANTQPATHLLAAELLSHGVDPSVINAKVLSERTPAGLRLLGDVVSHAAFHAEGAVVMGRVSLADAARFGISDGDLEGVIDALLYTAGVEIACMVIERDSGAVKLSLRSRSVVDVAALARSLDPGGGGHVRAAGVTLFEPLSDVLARLPGRLVDALAATR